MALYKLKPIPKCYWDFCANKWRPIEWAYRPSELANCPELVLNTTEIQRAECQIKGYNEPGE